MNAPASLKGSAKRSARRVCEGAIFRLVTGLCYFVRLFPYTSPFNSAPPPPFPLVPKSRGRVRPAADEVFSRLASPSIAIEGERRRGINSAECEPRVRALRGRGADRRDWRRSPRASGALLHAAAARKQAYDGGEEGGDGGGEEGEQGSEVNVAQRRGERMERRPAAASARTRGLLAGVCLIWIIGGICATGKSRSRVTSFHNTAPTRIPQDSYFLRFTETRRTTGAPIDRSITVFCITLHY